MERQQDELLHRSPVFNALSKRPTLMGVDYDYFFVAAMAVMLVFIYSSNVLSFLLVLPLQLLGWILIHIDSHIFPLLSVRSHIGVNRNRRLWRCQSYDAC